LQRELQVDIQWLAFPLHPETPPEGRTLQDLFAGRPIDIPQMLSHLKQVALDLRLPFGDRHLTYNSRRAQELGKWAEQKGKGDPFHNAVFRAYFAKNDNIYDMDILATIADSIGLDGNDARAVLDSGTFREAVDRDWAQAYKTGITAVPTFVINGQTLVGAQPYIALKNFILQQQPIRDR
jgi:predicted DsbA family dithiol-disulfide isomerase